MDTNYELAYNENQEESYQTNKRNKYMYSLYDAITNSLLYRYLYNKKEESNIN